MKLSTACAALFLVSSTVDSFTSTNSVQSLQSRQHQSNSAESLIVNYNNVDGRDGEEEDETAQRRFGMNIMGVLSGQLYATKVRHQQLRRGND